MCLFVNGVLLTDPLYLGEAKVFVVSIVSRPFIIGLDLEFVVTPIKMYWKASNASTCDDGTLSSSFDEAQVALSAESLDDLQSTHVVSEGSKEVRNNVKHPTGFLKKISPLTWRGVTGKGGGGVRAAKSPDLPYEKRISRV